MTLTPQQEGILRDLYLGGRWWICVDAIWSKSEYVRFTRAICYGPDRGPIGYHEGETVIALIDAGLLKGKVPKHAGDHAEITLTDAGAKAIGHDTAAARKAEKVTK